MQKNWLVREISPAVPEDWTPYDFLVLEIRASSAQYIEIRLKTESGAPQVRFQPFQGAWIRAAIPLRHFREKPRGGHDLASMGNQPRTTFFITFAEGQTPLKGVTAVEMEIPHPVRGASFEVRAIGLSKDDPGDAVLDDRPVVDEFGQWISQDWDGKAHSLEELRQNWQADEVGIGAALPGFSPYGGFLAQQVGGSGFFRVEKIDGRWWFVDPEGYLFFSNGADCILPFGETRTLHREKVFAALPPAEIVRPFIRENRIPTTSYIAWNLQRRFGDDWMNRWVEMTLRRMEAWGLNTVASWSDPRLWKAHRRPYTVTLTGWGVESGYMGLPDIYAADYPERIERAAAEQCIPLREDPWLLGYFVANEPAWPEREESVAQMILDGSETATRRALVDFLSGQDTPARRVEFMLQSFEKFLNMILTAIRKYDSNHLTLGIRFGSSPPEAVVKLTNVFDVYSHNIYDYTPSHDFIERHYQLTGRPMIIGEFHAGTPGRGMSSGLVQVGDWKERGTAYRYYVENAAAHPALIGTHWFQWWDQPNTGRGDGENYNIGLVDVTDRPYPEMVDAMQQTHPRLAAVHAGTKAPFDRLPEGCGDVIHYT